jgi:dCTP deaminase
MTVVEPADFALLNPGTIVDTEIIRLAREGKLIIGAFEEANVKQACYELRASDLFFETSRTREDHRIEVSSGEAYLLRPHAYVTAIVMESIDLPANVLGRILTKGQLFSVGLLPVNTYADPGFQGRLGITLCNTSHQYLLLRPGQAIAKIEFSVLPAPVGAPYRGQHGFATGIWPVPMHLIAKQTDLDRLRVKPGSSSELAISHGEEIAGIVQRFRFYERKLWLHVFLTISILLAAIGYFGRTDWMLSIVLGVIGNLMTTLVLWVFASRQQRTAK